MPRPAFLRAPTILRARILRAPAILAALLATTAFAATAHASDRWTVTDMKGHVKVSRSGQWHTLEPGMDVAVGAWVKTGASGRVTLERQGTTIEVKPRTQIAVAGRSLSPDKTVLMQRWGATSLDVDKRDEPHLEVHTPFLAAVVKGTTLDVNVGRTRSDIGVRTGSVEVRDDARGASVDLGSGQSVAAGQGRNGAMRPSGPRSAPAPIVRQIAPAPVIMAPIGRSAPVTAETADMSPRKLMANVVLRGMDRPGQTQRRSLVTSSSDDDDRRSRVTPARGRTALRGPTPDRAGDGTWGGLLPGAGTDGQGPAGGGDEDDDKKDKDDKDKDDKDQKGKGKGDKATGDKDDEEDDERDEDERDEDEDDGEKDKDDKDEDDGGKDDGGKDDGGKGGSGKGGSGKGGAT